MTTTLKLTYESGNGAIEVSKPNSEPVILSKQGDETTLSIYHSEDQVVTVKEVGFADQTNHCGEDTKADNGEEPGQGSNEEGAE